MYAVDFYHLKQKRFKLRCTFSFCYNDLKITTQAMSTSTPSATFNMVIELFKYI